MLINHKKWSWPNKNTDSFNELTTQNVSLTAIAKIITADLICVLQCV